MLPKLFFTVALLLIAALALGVLPTGKSVYTTRLDDKRAVYLTAEAFGVKGDGLADDTQAIQQAIDKIESTTHQGILFVPQGRYRLSKTINVWPGIRIIGYGNKRPTFVLGASTPGYQEGEGKYMFWFTGGQGRDGEIRDANPGTFYSAMSNVNLEIQDGNPAAIGVRSHWAQHCFLAHIDFQIGQGRAGIEQVGNESEDLRFFGGDYGIITTKPSPSWPYALLDSLFQGQSKAAIKTEEGGLTLVRCRFISVPTAISINPDRAEELIMKNCLFQDIFGPALIINDFKSARTEINVLSSACINVATLARFRENDSVVKGLADSYLIKQFTHGLQIADLGKTPQVKTTLDLRPEVPEPAAKFAKLPSLPSTEKWVNIQTLGAKGDGVTDDTAAFKKAIATYPTIYVPSGRYIVSDTLILKGNTALIGLNPITTQIALADSTPGFNGDRPAAPKPLIESPPGGNCILNGLVVDTGGINSHACGVKWQSGGYINDVKFYGGHGSIPFVPTGATPPARRGGFNSIYNTNHTGDADPRRKWDAQYPSLWVAGGSGVFKDIWTASTFAQAGAMISDSSGPGEIYAMSSEHHVRNEIVFRRSSNWQVYALQMEEERGEGPNVLPLSIDDCSDLTFGNLYIYRVMSTYSPFPYGVLVRRSQNLRFLNVHTYGPSKFTVDDTVFDETTGARSRSREIASLIVSGDEVSVAKNATIGLKKLGSGFNNADSLTTDAEGNLYFVDNRWNKVYRWTDRGGLELLRDSPTSPCGLAVDQSGNVVVVTTLGAVYGFKPGSPDDQMTPIEPVKADGSTEATAVIPTTFWRDSHDFLEGAQQQPTWRFYSPDHSLFIAADNAYHAAGPMSAMYSTVDLIRAYQLTKANKGDTVYIADEFGQKTYAFTVAEGGVLTNPKVFAEEGEAGVTTDPDGNVYVCAGDIFVYNHRGRLLRRIQTPERPTSIAFGGKDGRTLYIGARGSLYSLRVKG